MKANRHDTLEFRDLEDGITTIVTICEPSLGDETVAPMKTKIREGLLSRLDAGRTSFVLNLGGVVMMDSCGLASIISVKRLLDQRDASLALTNLSDLLERLFHLTRLDRVIVIHPTEAEALAAR